MALSNIFREPRREITESAVGLIVFAAMLATGWFSSLWTWRSLGWPLNEWYCFIGVGLGAVVMIVVAWTIIEFTHDLGDAICNGFERGGIHLRPRVRR